ncbi:Hypothetical predicted protein, partial [Paramuricea clavata]
QPDEMENRGGGHWDLRSRKGKRYTQASKIQNGGRRTFNEFYLKFNQTEQKATIITAFHNEPANISKKTSFNYFFSCYDNKCDEEQCNDHKRPSYLSSIGAKHWLVGESVGKLL